MQMKLAILLFCFFANALTFAQSEDGKPSIVPPADAEAQPAPETVEEFKPEAAVGEADVRDLGRERREWRREWRHRSQSHPPYIRADLTVEKGETHGDIVIIAGKLKIEGEVDGDIVAVASEAYINGPVRGSVVVVPGPVTFGPKAEIGREAVVVGEYKREAGAVIKHFQPVPIPEMVPVVTGAKDFLLQGVLLMRPLPPGVRWVWVVHVGIFLALLGLTLLFPKPVQVSAAAIADRPVVSMISGFLTALLFIPVIVLLVVSVVGIVAVPFAVVGLVFAGLFGKAAVMQFLGLQIGRNLKVSIFESPLVALIIGAVLLSLLYMVPILGLLIWIVATLLGIGAVMVATGSALNNRPTEPTPVGAAIPPAPASPGPVPGTANAPSAEPASAPATAMAASPAMFRRVGFWKRTFAALLDWLLLSIPMFFAQGFFPLILIVYFVGMWTWKGTSIGKICLGLKIVRVDGAPIDFAVALVRSLASCFSFVVFFLGFFWAGWDKQKQSWHDKIAGTIVVQVPRGVSLL